LLPDFRRSRLLVRSRVGLVAELIDVEGVWRLARELRRAILIVIGVALVPSEPRHHRLAPSPSVKDLLLAHLVWNDEQQPVALLAGDERKPESGVASGRLDQVPAGLM